MTTAPIINLNGTSPEALLDQHLEAIEGLRGAISTMAMCAPNGRDFQTAPADAFCKALNEHRGRMLRLENLMTEMEQLASLIHDQMLARLKS